MSCTVALTSLCTEIIQCIWLKVICWLISPAFHYFIFSLRDGNFFIFDIMLCYCLNVYVLNEILAKYKNIQLEIFNSLFLYFFFKCDSGTRSKGSNSYASIPLKLAEDDYTRFNTILFQTS